MAKIVVRVGDFYRNSYIEYESNGYKRNPYQSNNTLMKLNHTRKI